MAIISGVPISTIPISGSQAAATPNEETIPTQMTAVFEPPYFGEEENEFDFSGVQAAPLEDTPVLADAEIKTFMGFFDVVVDETDEFYPTDFATGPPDQDDEYVRSLQTNNDWVDEDEPVTDGAFGSPLAFPDDETGETTGRASNNDWIDEDEPVTDGTFGSPLEDTPVATDDAINGVSNNDVTDDDEPVADGWFASPIDQVDDYVDTCNLQPQDEDEPVTDGTFGSPLDDAPVIDTTIVDRSNNDWVEEDESVTDGAFGSPLEDFSAPPTPPSTQGDTGYQVGGGQGSGVPGFHGRTTRLHDLHDDLRRLRRLELIRRRKKERENERRKRLLIALLAAMGLLDE